MGIVVKSINSPEIINSCNDSTVSTVGVKKDVSLQDLKYLPVGVIECNLPAGASGKYPPYASAGGASGKYPSHASAGGFPAIKVTKFIMGSVSIGGK